MLLLAGMLSDSASWAPLLPLLEPHFTLIRPDNRTTGRTRCDTSSTRLSQMVADAMALLDHLETGPTHLVGHSLGGLLALALASQRPASRLTMLACAPMRMPRTLAIFETLHQIRSTPNGETLWLRALYPWIFGPAFFETPGAIDQAIAAATAYPHAQSADAMAHQIAALREFDLALDGTPPDCPAQLLLGEEDILIPEPAARAAFAQMTDLQISVMGNAGHALHWEVPDAVARHLLAFHSESR